MIKRHTAIVFFVALIASSAILVFAAKHKQAKKQVKASSSVFYGSAGWGYNIFVGDSLFIHQELIPAIATKKGFSTKQQAEKAARIILQKMQQGQPPVLTKLDVEPICLTSP